MKAFQFRLKHILNLREQTEELQKLKLGQASRVCEELRQAIQNIRVQQSATNTLCNLDYLKHRQAWMNRLHKERAQLEVQEEEAQEKRKALILDYVQARQQAEILRNLREKKQEEFQKSYIQTLDMEMDDLVQSRLVIKRSQEES